MSDTSHNCEAIVVTCMDFRFQKMIRDWEDKVLPGKKYDLVSYAGSTKDLETVMKQLDISKRLHHINQVVLLHHENCGAYGEESTPEKHNTDLHIAKDEISKKYPDLIVDLYYVTLAGEFKKID